MKPFLPILLGFTAMTGLLAAIHFGADMSIRVALKADASAMFVLTTLLVARPNKGYLRLLLFGLLFGLAGDVLLEMKSESTFMAGLVAFLIGHLFYAVAFFGLLPKNKWLTPWQIPLWLIAVGVALHITPHAKEMLVPVILYVAVITIMVSGALAVWRDKAQPGGFAALVLIASILFFFSDYLVARNAFMGRTFLNTLVLLPAYYAAQFMFALSIGKAGAGRAVG